MAKQKPADSSFRMNISIPHSLKQRMDEYAQEVVWSNVAAEAFDRQVRELETRKKELSGMEKVVERLRKSREKSADEHYQRGVEYGKEWAKEGAEAVELERLATLKHDHSYHQIEHQLDALSIFNTILPEEVDDVDHRDKLEWWERNIFDESKNAFQAIANRPEFFRGFVDGACDIWRKVEPKL